MGIKRLPIVVCPSLKVKIVIHNLKMQWTLILGIYWNKIKYKSDI